MKVCPTCKMRYPDEGTHCILDNAALEPLVDGRIGTTIAGRYVIERVLGEGGMATVYGARHKLVDRPYAVKIMHTVMGADQTVRERFRREAKSAQKLAHPNIIEIYEQGDTDDGTAYMVMEYLQGRALADIISQGAIETSRCVGLMIQLARGIARAHDLEVIHRDLKPENVFLCRREDGGDLIKILDFGIARSRHDARLTGAGELFGTPQYMAPERIKGEDAGMPADLYALGVVFFEMTTGKLPYDAPDITTYFIKHLNAPTPHPRQLNASVPQELDDLVVRMMAKDPAGRPVDAHRVEADLEAIAEKYGYPIPIEPETDPISTMRISAEPLEPRDPWSRRMSVCEEMLTRAFGAPASAPADLTKLLGQARDLVKRITDLRDERMKEIRRGEDIESRGREGRTRFGFAVDALGVDISKAREEERSARTRVASLMDAVTKAAAAVTAAQRDIAFWEGRSGGIEPYADLSAAYRATADAVDAWRAAKSDAGQSEAIIETAARTVTDLDFQIRELRNALAHHEQTVDRERTQHEERLAEMDKDVDQLESELSSLVTRFTEPLKARPELAPLFEQLSRAPAYAAA